MKEKGMIDLSLQGDEPYHEPPRTYYGTTLTSHLGGFKPCRSSIKSFQCSRLDRPTASLRTALSTSNSAPDKVASASRPTSAQSRGTTARSRVTSARSVATSTRSDFVSAPGRITSAWSKHTSVVSDGTTGHNRAASTINSTRCTSAFDRPLTSAAMMRSVTSCSRRSLRSRRKSPCSVASTWLISSGGSGSCPDLIYHIGLSVWLMEKGSLVLKKQADIGFFHQGNCYIVLQVASMARISLLKVNAVLEIIQRLQGMHQTRNSFPEAAVEFESGTAFSRGRSHSVTIIIVIAIITLLPSEVTL